MPLVATPELLPTVDRREPVRLAGHVGGATLPLSTNFRILLGVPFLAVGGLVLSIAARQLAGEVVPGARVPAGVMASVGALFGGLGSWLVVGGIVEHVTRFARAGRRRRFPDQPWLADYAWDRRGGRDRAPGELPRALGFLGVLAAFAGTFCWVGFVGGGGVPFAIGGTLMAVGVAFAAVHAARLAWRTLRWGRSRLRFADFPCAPGGEVEVIFDDLAPAVRGVSMRATLRCVQERWETTGGPKRRTEVVHWELWKATLEVAPGARSARFALPPDAPGTDLASRPSRFWELELVAEVPGVDYRASFLVPVY